MIYRITCFVLLSFLQLTVQASDQALPTDRTTTVQVLVPVPRDDKPPKFERTVYTTEIPEYKDVGSEVITVKANDENRQVSIKLTH